MATDSNSNTPAGFQRFVRMRAARSPTIALRKNGFLGINAGAAELAKAHRPDDDELWVELFYDAARGVIAVRAAEPKSANAYRGAIGVSGYCTINAVAFCRRFKIPHAETARYKAVEFEGGYVGFYLADEGAPA